jgi:poly(hydroxyalkanoate) granule-associated protein
MVKKMHAADAPAAKSDKTSKGAAHASNALAGAVKDSAQQIWLAGMGAFAKAQEEGTKVFEALVKEGMSLQKKTQSVAEEKIGEVTGKMASMADTVTAKAGQNWDKLEAIFEARTAKAMGKLGVPTAKDVDALAQRVDALAAAVAKLSKSAPGAAAKSASKPAKTATAKPVAAKRARKAAAA